jgi:hypothetical protein
MLVVLAAACVLSLLQVHRRRSRVTGQTRRPAQQHSTRYVAAAAAAAGQQAAIVKLHVFIDTVGHAADAALCVVSCLCCAITCC